MKHAQQSSGFELGLTRRAENWTKFKILCWGITCILTVIWDLGSAKFTNSLIRNWLKFELMADKWRKFLLITNILPPPSRPPIYWKKSSMKLWTIDWPIARTTQNSSKSTKQCLKWKKIYRTNTTMLKVKKNQCVRKVIKKTTIKTKFVCQNTAAMETLRSEYNDMSHQSFMKLQSWEDFTKI